MSNVRLIISNRRNMKTHLKCQRTTGVPVIQLTRRMEGFCNALVFSRWRGGGCGIAFPTPKTTTLETSNHYPPVMKRGGAEENHFHSFR